MTRFDLFIRNMILQKLHLYEFQLSNREEDIIDLMLKDIYQDQHLQHMSVESRVNHVVQTYQPMFHHLSLSLTSL